MANFGNNWEQPRLEKARRQQPVSWTLRLLGLLPPFLLTSFFLIFPIFPDAAWTDNWSRERLISGTILWVGFTAALLWRRDLRGAAVIIAFYVLFDAWMWILVVL